MDNIKAEIERVKTAIAKTKSPYLKRDYEKYLKKLLKRSEMNGKWQTEKRKSTP